MLRRSYLDGLRGIAALSVFMIHAHGWGLKSLGPFWASVVDHGKYGVTAFFVVSAYSLCLATEQRPIDWWNFYLRRICRIMPMYLVALAIASLFRIVQQGQLPSWISIIAHVTGANILMPRYSNDIISTEWTIAVESTFYILFPLFLWLARKSLLSLSALTVLIMLPSLRLLAFEKIGGDWFEFRGLTLGWHLYAFCLGLLAFRITRLPKAMKIIPPNAFVICAVIAFAWRVWLGENDWSAPVVAIGTVMIIIACEAGAGLNRWISLRPLAFVGTVSYSVYLLHTFGIALFGQILAVPVVLAVAAITQRYIERPPQNWARQRTELRNYAGKGTASSS